MYHYKEAKKAKLAILKKIGKDLLLSIIRFDSNTGKREKPSFIKLNKDFLEAKKVQCEKEAKDLGELLKDMKLLEKEKK